MDPLKAPALIWVVDSERVTDERDLQFKKQYPGMTVTPAGIVMSMMPQPSNALLPIVVRFEGSVMDVSLVSFLKQELPMAVSITGLLFMPN